MSIAEPPEVRPLDEVTRAEAVTAVDQARARGWTSDDLRDWFGQRGVTLELYLTAKSGGAVPSAAYHTLAQISITGLPDRPPGKEAEDPFPDLPAAMKAAERWLLWKSEPNADPTKKPRKVPYYATGDRRQGALDTPADVERLVSYTEACDALTHKSGYAGLGFALGPDGTGAHWQGIDLDNLDQHPGLKFLVEDGLPGYTERSPSGGGVHAIGYGRPFDSLGSNSTGIEAYAAGRYFTVTGESTGLGEPVCLADFVERRLAPLHTPRPQDTSASAQEAAGGTLAGTLASPDLRSALASMRSDDRDLWIRMGHALRSLGDVGRGLWLEWSQTSPKYDAADASRVWDSFKPERTGYQAVFAEAQRRGWVNPAAGRDYESASEQSAKADDIEPGPVFDPWEEYALPTFPMDCIPPRLRGFVEFQTRAMGADRGAIAMATLAACSGALDHRFSLKLKRSSDWFAAPRLWVLLVGPPSAMKTPVVRATLGPLWSLDAEISRQHAKDMARYLERKDAGEKDSPPPEPVQYVCDDITPDAAAALLANQDCGTLCVQDELSAFLGSMDKFGGKGGAAAGRGFWLQAYNGGPRRINRIVRGKSYIENCSASFLAGVQPQRLKELGNLASDGLLQRFLPVMMGRPTFVDQEVSGDDAVQGYRDTIGFFASMKPSQQMLSEAAQAVFDRFRKAMFDLEQLPGLGESFCSFVGKLPGVHGALMLILHLALDPQEAPYEPVEERTAQAASKILEEYVIPHALALYQESADRVDWEILRKIAGHILTSDKERFVPSDFTTNVRPLRGAATMEAAQKVSHLVAGGWLKEENGKGGNPVWTVVPGLREALAARRTEQLEEQAKTLAALQNLRKGATR